VVDHLREAERLAVDLDDRPRLGRVLAPLANEWWFLGDYESAVETGERALSIGTALGDVRIKVMARSPLGRAHHSLGNFGRAKSLYEDSLRELGAARKRDSFGLQLPPYVESSQRLAWTLVELGDFAEGLARAEEIAEICQSLTNWFGLAHALFTAGLVHLRRGDFQSAIPVLEQGIELCRSREFPVLMLPATAHLGYAYALAGPVAKALPLLEESVREAERLPMAWSQSLWAGWWAEALLLAGRADDAAALGQRALGLAVRRKERGQEAYAHRLLGEIASREERPGVTEAVRHYSQAMSLANERGMRPLAAHCHLGFGKLSRRTGKREQAQEHLATATTMYREMDMRFWLAQAAAELKELGA
jgi:tetratricopeptide (TPR) repeat protein